MKNITSTKLKQNAKEIIDQVVATDEPVIVYTYNEPRVIIMKYNKELVKKRKPTIEELKKYMIKAGKKTDFASYFRKMRDEE